MAQRPFRLQRSALLLCHTSKRMVPSPAMLRILPGGSRLCIYQHL